MPVDDRRRPTAVDEFLAAVMPNLRGADTALHGGDAGPRIALWSHEPPVTVFGALRTVVGWDEVRSAFEWLASRFTGCQSFDYEVVAAGVSGDLGYVAGIEHTVASVRDGPTEAYALRVTTVLRREGGEWKVVHRHADPAPDAGAFEAQRGRMLG